MFRLQAGFPEVLLLHPGGPFFARKDAGAWSIPKGEFEDTEEALDAAKREFEEETGTRPEGKFIPLAAVKLKSGKRIRAWAVQGDLDPATITSNTFEIEWPPRSGRKQAFPEIDKAAWFTLEEAKEKINAGQAGLINELAEMLNSL